jgi:hypothetical protein
MSDVNGAPAPATETFATPDDFGDLRASQLHTSRTEALAATAAEALDPRASPSAMWFFRRAREAITGGEMLPGLNVPDSPLPGDVDVMRQVKASIPDTSIEDARARVREAGLERHLKLPDQPNIKSPVLDLMVQEAQERRDREAAIARGPQGFLQDALGFATGIGAGMIDPVNVAAFSIPVVGEARFGKMLAAAGESLAARAGVRAGVGAAQGAAGTAILQPADWWLHTKDGLDYTMADALRSVVMGAGMGAAFHAGLGAIGDVRARRQGLPLPGSPEDLLQRGLMAGTHVRGDLLESAPGEAAGAPGTGPSPGEGEPEITNAGPATEGIPGVSAVAQPAAVLADLPPRVREDALRATVADLIEGNLARTGELLEEAAKQDPRIAESIAAYHGSPHDFDRFDLSKIGTGEGAQAFGHGLYFAENKDVAKGYRDALSGSLFVKGKNDALDRAYDMLGLHYDQSPETIIAKAKEALPSARDHVRHLEEAIGAGDVSEQSAPSIRKQIDYWKGQAQAVEEVSKSRPEDFAREPGALYKVTLKVDKEDLLDWDKPLNQQGPKIIAGLKRFAKLATKEKADEGGSVPQSAHLADSDIDIDVETFQRQLRYDFGEITGAELLREAGIPGIKYLDQGSRLKPFAADRIKQIDRALAESPSNGTAADEARIAKLQAEREQLSRPETHNFVIFDDKLIRITQKNGQEVGLDEMRAAVAQDRNAPPPPDVEAAKADWQRLADARRPDDEDLAETSKRAEKIPEPESIDPEKAPSAAEAAAREADALLADLLPRLTDEERRAFEDVLDRLDRDKAAEEQMVRDGVACLAAAEA